MKELLTVVFGTAITNILTFLVYQGFVKCYWGRNMREEITRFFDNLRKGIKSWKKR